ncbi:ABC transporter permease [Candidatus Pacearchaeota archaeon]|nr:ABC transporter permease [Candidatus Pacearchaeota archaeon]
MYQYIRLALSNLAHRGLRSLLTLVGIFIGIAAVVALISLGNGLQEAITGQFATLSADRLVIQNAGDAFGPPGAGSIAKLTDHDKKIVASTSGVSRVLSRYVRIGRMDFNKIAGFEFLSSFPSEQDDFDYFVESFKLEAAEGKIPSADERGTIVIGSGFTENTYGKPLKVGTSVTIQGKSFEIIGILKETGSFQFNTAIFMAEDDLKKIFNIENEIDFIVAQVTDLKQVDNVAEAIKRALRKDRNEKEGSETFSVESPLQALSAINTILIGINAVIAGIAAISLMVGGVGVANTMYTSVLERTREIGTMKALGAHNRDILKVFMTESALLGLVGGIGGALIGLILAFAVSGIASHALGGITLAVTISYPLISASILFAFILGLFAGTLPAIKASKLNTVEALRS